MINRSFIIFNNIFKFKIYIYFLDLFKLYVRKYFDNSRFILNNIKFYFLKICIILIFINEKYIINI